MSGKQSIGFVVVYRNNPEYKGLDRCLIRTELGKYDTDCDLDKALVFLDKRHAIDALSRFPDVSLRKNSVSTKAHLAGEVIEVFEETHRVLGSRAHITEFLKSFKSET